MSVGILRRVACGMSGGVDSTVSALLLKNRGYEVVGVFMRNWDLTDETGHCSADEDAEVAERICKRLGVEFKQVNFVKEYWNEVFTPLVHDYECGRTPNPDIMCNRNIKFNYFHRHCLEFLNCQAVATGHYARTSYGEDLEYAKPDENARLLKAIDYAKDQTFFLAQISQQSLRRSIFPVGGFTKGIVKKLAAANGFEDIAKKKESMGICFIGKRKHGFQRFIEEYIEEKPGDMVDIDSGKVLARHQGVHHWTIGQHVGLSGQTERVYVASKDATSRTLYVCCGKDHPALFSEHFFAAEPHWISKQPESLRHGSKSMECEFRFQNTQPLTKCVVSIGMSPSAGGNWEFMDQRTLVVSSAEPLRAVSPGQFVAFYQGEECLGSAVIERAGPSLFVMRNAGIRKDEI